MSESMNIDVASACIAAEIHHAATLAKGLSLTAKNAQAISIRAGESSLGFKAITVFINEFAETIITQANKINEQAVTVSRLCIEQVHAKMTAELFIRAGTIAGEDSYRDDLTPIATALDERAKKKMAEMESLLKQLGVALAESERQMRAAGIIATTSKTEASRAAEYQDSLYGIANTIESTSADIRSHLKAASVYLSELEVKG